MNVKCEIGHKMTTQDTMAVCHIFHVCESLDKCSLTMDPVSILTENKFK